MYGRWRDGRSFDPGRDAAWAARFPWAARAAGTPRGPGERA